jgi:hypothetical protein
MKNEDSVSRTSNQMFLKQNLSKIQFYRGPQNSLKRCLPFFPIHMMYPIIHLISLSLYFEPGLIRSWLLGGWAGGWLAGWLDRWVAVGKKENKINPRSGPGLGFFRIIFVPINIRVFFGQDS